MTPDEIIAAAKVPNTNSMFVLGCLESRVTVYAQQVRALNLVDSIIERDLVRSNGRVAIIGGGAGGLTAAAAMALAMPGLRTIDIYEQKHDLLHLQSNSPDRYLHPHIYDWPNADSLSPDAGLPILNWRAGTAGEVAKQILANFEAVRQHTRTIHTKPGHQVERVLTSDAGCRVSIADNPRGGDFYDIAILSVGFGYEREIGEKNHSYWDPHQLSGPIRKEEPTHRILVSGNGDGGLVDFITAAFRGVTHREIFEFVTQYPGLDAAIAALQEIEERAWRSDEERVDLFEQYQVHVRGALPSNLLLDLADKLRPAVTVLFHTRTEHLFRRNTAVLNRFVAFLAITADANRFGDAIKVVRNAELDSKPTATIVKFDNGEEFEPSFRYLRFGADTEKNLRPFADQVDALRAVRGDPPPGYRPATPPLTATAKTRFEVFSQMFGADLRPSVASRGAKLTQIKLFLRSVEPGVCEWIGDVPPADVNRLWRDNAPLLLITCDMPVGSAGALRSLVARLTAHVARYELFCPDPASWTEFLCRYIDQALPGPSLDVKFAVHRPAGDTPTGTHRVTLDCGTLADQVHSLLNNEVIEQLNSELHACLSSPQRRHFGWDVEPRLRGQMLALWNGWYGQLRIHEDHRRRFLVLLSTLKDESTHSDDLLVCIGPKIIKQHLVRSTILALAFTSAVDHSLVPVGSYPGNLKATSMVAHASGVSWLDGKFLGPDVVSQNWTTGLVLLSELQTPSALIRAGLPRLDSYVGATPRIGDVAVNERPVILGCDYELQQALSRGASAVRGYVNAIFEERAAAATGLLER